MANSAAVWFLVLVLLRLEPTAPSGAYRDTRPLFDDGLRFGRGASHPPGEGGRAFVYLDYASTHKALAELQKEHPTLVRLFSAQDNPAWAADTPSPGACGDQGPCKQWYAQITADADHPAWADVGASGSGGGSSGGSGGDPHAAARAAFAARPEVFFSGSLHGNERVGPTTTVEFARLLVENYVHGSNTWLRRLVDTRSIWIMPNANAKGYYENIREEPTPHSGRIDPNRDFPYGVRASECMRTTAARALNHLFREHLFQLAITFHGGMRAISYEWGSPNHATYSPDDGALLPLGTRMQQYASGSYYPTRYVQPMNVAVYGVKGGMEDWAYASSWDKTGYVKPCSPSTRDYPAYPKSLTTYSSDMLRVFNILVETADRKAPAESTLGAVNGVLQPVGRASDGHVARNLRLALLLTDLVQPYAAWSDVGGHCSAGSLQAWWNEVVRPAAAAAAQGGESEPLPEYTMAWDVGGALKVDETKLFVWYERVEAAHDPDGLQDSGAGCGGAGRVVAMSGPSGDGNSAGMNPEVVPADVDRVLSVTSGKDFSPGAGDPPRGYRVAPDERLGKGGSVWGTGIKSGPGESADGTHTFSASALFPDDVQDSAPFGFNGRYKANISVDGAAAASALRRKEGGATTFLRMVVVAGARVDAGWAKPTRAGVTPKNEPPISHVVKARTIAGYSASNNGLKIVGQKWWFSERRCVRLVQAAKEEKGGAGAGGGAPPAAAPSGAESAASSKGSISGSSGLPDDDAAGDNTPSKAKGKGAGAAASGGDETADGDKETKGGTLAGGTAARGPWTLMLVLTSAASFLILSTVTVMHSRGVLADTRGEGDTGRSEPSSGRKRRVRRRSSQMNEFSPLKDVGGSWGGEEEEEEEEEYKSATTSV